ncbi:hypothetical protein JCM11641_004660 [Rhodosporidiobolus odoratus]
MNQPNFTAANSTMDEIGRSNEESAEQASAAPFDRLPDELLSEICSAAHSLVDILLQHLCQNKRLTRLAQRTWSTSIVAQPSRQPLMFEQIILHPAFQTQLRALDIFVTTTSAAFFYECTALRLLTNLDTLTVAEGPGRYARNGGSLLPQVFTDSICALPNLTRLNIAIPRPVQIRDIQLYGQFFRSPASDIAAPTGVRMQHVLSIVHDMEPETLRLHLAPALVVKPAGLPIFHTVERLVLSGNDTGLHETSNFEAFYALLSRFPSLKRLELEVFHFRSPVEVECLATPPSIPFFVAHPSLATLLLRLRQTSVLCFSGRPRPTWTGVLKAHVWWRSCMEEDFEVESYTL